ncbi:metallopeptidase family protein [Cellulomonas fimi]|nr:metallopeptidase family protein [Cellulomonas fimi]
MTSQGPSHSSAHPSPPGHRGVPGRRGGGHPAGVEGAVQPVRRRDRRGRGPRGPLMPSTMPAYRTRAERFDDLVLDAVERLERRWRRQLDGTEFAVEDVPPSDPAPWESGGVPLGRYFPADAGLPARIVVYRRPVESRAADPGDLADLVRDVVVEQVAHMLDRDPEDVDPGYGEDH